MTGRRRRSRRSSTFTADDVPALAAFARAYLHQDVLIEHGSAAGAVRAFRDDAGEEEWRRLEHDLRRLANATAGWPDARLARFFHGALGAAWAPQSPEELAEICATAHPPGTS